MMPTDLQKHELANLSYEKSVDFFQLYRQKVAALAYQNLDLEEDSKFFSYLDKLVNNVEYMKKINFNGRQILDTFISGEASLSQV